MAVTSPARLRSFSSTTRTSGSIVTSTIGERAEPDKAPAFAADCRAATARHYICCRC